MKHYNKAILLSSWAIPFTTQYEVLHTGCVSYNYRGINGTKKGYHCDFLEVRDMLTNKVFYNDLYWFEIEFVVYNLVQNKLDFRVWRFVEGADEHHYWLDVENRKWHKAD